MQDRNPETCGGGRKSSSPGPLLGISGSGPSDTLKNASVPPHKCSIKKMRFLLYGRQTPWKFSLSFRHSYKSYLSCVHFQREGSLYFASSAQVNSKLAKHHKTVKLAVILNKTTFCLPYCLFLLLYILKNEVPFKTSLIGLAVSRTFHLWKNFSELFYPSSQSICVVQFPSDTVWCSVIRANLESVRDLLPSVPD